MFKKSKSNSNALSELHFVSSLALEQSVMLIGDIADEHHQVTLTEMTPDEFQFQINYLPEKTRQGEIKGRLQRWNATETKLDARGTVFRGLAEASSNSQTSTTMASIFLTFMMSSAVLATGQGWMAVPIIAGGLGLAFYNSNFETDSKKPQKVIFRHRDYLFQRLIDAFKSSGEVEAL